MEGLRDCVADGLASRSWRAVLLRVAGDKTTGLLPPDHFKGAGVHYFCNRASRSDVEHSAAARRGPPRHALHDGHRDAVGLQLEICCTVYRTRGSGPSLIGASRISSPVDLRASRTTTAVRTADRPGRTDR